MRRQVRRNTKPELALRRELHRRGLRYRVDRSILPGSRRRHDIVFSRWKVVVDVRGCYWHACPLHATRPKANAEWWADKLSQNVRRDRDTEEQLRVHGWDVVIVWEHEAAKEAADRVEAAIQNARRGRRS